MSILPGVMALLSLISALIRRGRSLPGSVISYIHILIVSSIIYNLLSGYALVPRFSISVALLGLQNGACFDGLR